MPAGVPVATVAVNGAKNAGILAAQIVATNDSETQEKLINFKEKLKEQVELKAENLAKEKINA